MAVNVNVIVNVHACVSFNRAQHFNRYTVALTAPKVLSPPHSGKVIVIVANATSRFSESRDKLVYLCRALAMSRKREYQMIFRVLSRRTQRALALISSAKLRCRQQRLFCIWYATGGKIASYIFNLDDNANVNHTHLISDAKIQYRESEVNNII